MTHHFSAPLVVALLGLSAGAAHAQQIVGVRDARAIRADSVFHRYDRTDSPGCAMGVYQDGKVLYARGYGMASLELGVPLSPRRSSIGSRARRSTGSPRSGSSGR